MRKFQQYITEGVYDPAIFKAFFLAGGPGSGKSWVSARALSGMGLKVINSDNAFTRLLGKEQMSLKFADHTPAEIEKRDNIRSKSKAIAGMQLGKALEGRLGLIIDSTARDVEKIQQEAKKLRNLGYDIHMVFVNTSLDVALERNRNRPRKLPDAIIINSHKQIQKNMGRLQRIFGSRNFVVVDNNEPAEDVNPTVNKRIRNLVDRAPTSYQAVKCIHRQQEQRKRMDRESEERKQKMDEEAEENFQKFDARIKEQIALREAEQARSEQQLDQLVGLGEAFANRLAMAAIEGQNMEKIITSAVKSIAAELAARAAIFGLLNVLSGGTGGMAAAAAQRTSGGFANFLLSGFTGQTPKVNNTINISGGLVSSSYVRNTLVPAINKSRSFG